MYMVAFCKFTVLRNCWQRFLISHTKADQPFDPLRFEEWIEVCAQVDSVCVCEVIPKKYAFDSTEEGSSIVFIVGFV